MADKKDKEEAKTEGHIVPRNITTEMKESYLDYAMSVITARALPDVRDGLKPVHRRILYAMANLGLSHTARFRKSAAVVGEVLGKYHPHGDASVYDALVKMAQDFSYRYPLILGQGNFGSVDGDAAAAMRYTEAKMSRLSGELLRDIEKQTVEWRNNYDNTKKEPSVLPSAVPNLLLNGALGIAVGMATNIPPHNISEVIDATICLIDDKDATNEDVLTYIAGPDFPTGGIVFNAKDIAHAYATGRGGVVVRGEAEIVEDGNTTQIVITSLPYRVNKAEFVMRIAELVRDKKIEGIRALRDESARGENRVVVDLKSGSHPQKVLNYLYKHTDLETIYHYNMLSLVDGVPRTLSLKEILEEFIRHRETVVRRRAEFDKARAEERAHILIGLKKALDHIDKIIKLIKASADTPTAHKNLMKEFKFSDAQAIAILDMKLQKLAGLERKNIEKELEEKLKLIAHLKELLASPKKILSVIKDELVGIKKTYGDPRRTKVVKGGVRALSMEDIIADEETVVVLTKGGYIKRTNPSEYRRQKRGGIGVHDLNTKEEDFITMLVTGTTHNDVLFFTNKGKVYQSKMYEIPEGKRATKGKSIMNFLPLAQDEEITSVLPLPKTAREVENLSLSMVTRNGIIKKVAAESFIDVRKSGIIAITLKKGDALLSVVPTKKGDSIVLSSSKGQAIRFKESDVREMGRTASGVRGMKLSNGDFVVGADVSEKDKKGEFLLSVSEKGYGKRTLFTEYKVQRRGGSGIKTAKVTDKTGRLIVSRVVTEEDSEIVVISKQSQVIRVALNEVPSLGRQTQGVRIMKLRERDSIATFICL